MGTARENAEVMEGRIEEFQTKLGLPTITSCDVEKYLNCDAAMLKSMSHEDCDEAALLLLRETLYIQTEINKLSNRMEWAKFRLDRIIAEEIGQYDQYMKDDYKRHAIVKSSTAASEYQLIVNECERYLRRLDFIPKKLNDLAEFFGRCGQSKRRANEASRSY